MTEQKLTGLQTLAEIINLCVHGCRDDDHLCQSLRVPGSLTARTAIMTERVRRSSNRSPWNTFDIYDDYDGDDDYDGYDDYDWDDD